MANEILALEGTPERLYSLLFLFPIAVPKQVGGANVVPTPSSELDDLIVALLNARDVNIVSALDAGTMAFLIVQIRKEVGLSGAALLSKARAAYAAQLALFNANYTLRYAHLGTFFNAE